MSARNSIQVGIKVRPLLTKEKEKDMLPHWNVIENTICHDGSQNEPYCFDYVFDHDSSNQVIFEKMAKHIIHSTVHGFNGTIFAYGQTASGKTYTMMGEESDPGVMVLAAQEVFNEIDRTSSNSQFLLRGGFIEIYNEKVYDLLNKSNPELKIHETTNGNAHVNCEEVIINSEEQLLKVLALGNAARTVGETNMNERSSRSHAIFRLIIESRQTDSAEDDKVTQSVLNLVDLAGSERADQTGARGARLKEGGHINKSLLFLSTVIKRLSENEDNKYISYRDSKLTRILQASLGGNAFTSIICTVNPTSIEETQSTLNFALRAKTIKNKPQLNEIVSDATMMKRLNREITDLRKQLDEERRKNASQLKVAQIEQLLDCKQLNFVNSSKMHTVSNQKLNRRRTWCAQTIDSAIESTSIIEPSLPSTNPFRTNIPPSRLRPPNSNVYYTPKIPIRDAAGAIEYQFTSNSVMPIEETFEPAEFFDFGKYPSSPKTPGKSAKSGDNCFQKLSDSPITLDLNQHVRMVEEQLESLQEFTSLEEKLGVQNNPFKNMKFELDALYERNKVLEKERITYLETKNEIHLVKEQLHSSDMRADNLQVEIDKLKNDKLASDRKVEQYEAELIQQKAKLDILEIENRNAVSLQFEFETYRNKAKQREKELLEVLNEKDMKIVGLEKQLKGLQAERRLKDCCESDSFKEKNAQIACQKCEDLQRMLDGRKQAELEFEELTKKYEELQINYQQINAKLDEEQKSRVVQLAEREEKLRLEIETLQEKLVNVESVCEDLKVDCCLKSERCESLLREVNDAEQQVRMLQHKYDTLEGNFQKHEQVIGAIKTDYNALEKQYNELKTTYDNLENSSNKSTADCTRLQLENDGLQDEIQKLRTRIEDMQEKLLNGTMVTKKEPDQKENDCTIEKLELLRFHNNLLMTTNKELETQYGQLQQEYEQLSTNVMESVDENDKLLRKVKKLEEELKASEAKRVQGYKESRLSCDSEQAKLIDFGDNNNDNNFESNQVPCLEHIDLIEFENRHYIPINISVKSKDVVPLKLSLENWVNNRNSNESKLNARIEEWKKPKEDYEVVSKGNVQYLNETIENLEKLVETLKAKNEELFESSQRDVHELREEIKLLMAELLEKSVVLEDLVKERAEISLLNEELQIKVAMSRNNSMNNISSNLSANSIINETICQPPIMGYVNEKAELSINDTFKTLKIELMQKDEECNQLKLEMLQKLELAESEFRCHLRKYNQDWEENRRKYKQRINELEEILLEKGISIKTEPKDEKIEMKNSLQFNSNLDDGDVIGVKSEYEENCVAFNREDKTTSTPTTPPITPSNNFKESQKTRLERSIMVQECNDQISKLHIAIEETKSVNMKLADNLAEKEVLLQEKQLIIDNLEVKIKELERHIEECQISNTEVDGFVTDLEEKIEILETLNGTQNDYILDLKAKFQEVESKSIELEDQYRKELKEREEIAEIQNRRRIELEANLRTFQDELNVQEKLKNEMEKELKQWKIKYKNLESLRDKFEACSLEFADQRTAQVELEKRLNAMISQNEALQVDLAESNKSKQDVISKVEDLKEKIKMNESLKSELERLQKEKRENDEIIVKMQKKIDGFEELDGEHSRLQAQLIVIKSENAKAEKKFQEEKEILVKELNACKLERKEFQERSETFEMKLATITKELRESMKHSTECYEKATRDHNITKEELKLVTKKKTEMEQEIATLKSELRKSKEDLNLKSQNERNELENMKGRLEQLQAEHAAITEQNSTLEQLVSELKSEVLEAQKMLKHTNTEVDSQFKELQLNCASLTDALAAKMQEFKQRSLEAKREAEEHERTKAQLIAVQCQLNELQARMKESADQATEMNTTLQVKLNEQQKACIDLRNKLLAKESSYEQAKLLLEKKITQLQIDNKSLSDRLEAAHEIIKSNNSLEMSSHSTNSSLSRSSPCKNSTNVNAEDKFLTIQKERRHRRISTHDENRRQSAKFKCSVDVSTLTDAVIVCECDELKRKLSECETQLYIRKSQVTALNLELRNHPLKAEKVALVKRIQEEQEKGRLEIKKLKTKISEQAAKIQEMLDQPNIATTSVPLHIITTDRGTSISPRKNYPHVETQTDMEIDQSLHKLQGKYNDLKKICRFRYTRIKELEKTLEEKENISNCQRTEANHQQYSQATTADKSSQKACFK